MPTILPTVQKKVKDDVNKVLMATPEVVTDAIKQKVSIIGLILKNVLIWVSPQIEMESQVPVLQIQAELESNSWGAFCNVATCQAVLHNRMAEVCQSLLERIVAVAGSDQDIAVAGSGKIERKSRAKRPNLAP